jgi:hypothetical protein
LVKIEHLGKTRFNDVVFNWKSLTPEIIDNTGKIINHINNGQVDYEVEVEYNNEKRKYQFTGYLNHLS